MKDFLPGERVICNADYSEHYSKEGTLTQEWCEYGDHVWGVNFDDGTYAEIGYDGLEYVEDPYEYNIEGTDLVTGKTKLWRETWEPKPDWLKSRVDPRNEYDDRLRNAGGSPEYTRRLVKRRKAGRIEDV